MYDASYLQTFLDECAEHLATVENDLIVMESQASDEEFRSLADAVIDNNHSQECTAAQVRELLHGREGIDT